MIMLTIPRRTILASAPQLNRFVFRIPSCTPLSLRLPWLGPQRDQRHFSASSRPQIQYTRFSDGYTYHNRRPSRDTVAKVLVAVTAVGVVYYVAQYVDKLRHSPVVDALRP